MIEVMVRGVVEIRNEVQATKGQKLVKVRWSLLYGRIDKGFVEGSTNPLVLVGERFIGGN